MTEKEENSLCDHLSVSLKEYFESKMAAVHDALVLSRADLNRRLEDLNQLRKEVTADRGLFVTKLEYDTAEKERNLWRETVSKQLAGIEGQSAAWAKALGLFFTIIQILVSTVLYFVLHK